MNRVVMTVGAALTLSACSTGRSAVEARDVQARSDERVSLAGSVTAVSATDALMEGVTVMAGDSVRMRVERITVNRSRLTESTIEADSAVQTSRRTQQQTESVKDGPLQGWWRWLLVGVVIGVLLCLSGRRQ